MYSKVYSVSEAAAKLPQPFSNQDLYYFLKLEGIVNEYRRPNKEFVYKGILVESTGSRCAYHKHQFPSTKFTKKGIDWLLNDFYPMLIVKYKVNDVSNV